VSALAARSQAAGLGGGAVDSSSAPRLPMNGFDHPEGVMHFTFGRFRFLTECG
jgi:hypothetical protein